MENSPTNTGVRIIIIFLVIYSAILLFLINIEIKDVHLDLKEINSKIDKALKDVNLEKKFKNKI